jgi:hypothetical protein
MKRTFLLFALLTTLGAHFAACSDDDTDEHGDHAHDDGGADDADGG